MSEQEVIQFDVGGTLYKVALSTLMKFPDTILAALPSERWQQQPANSNHDLMFIDRDGELFKYILAWYHVMLPWRTK
jgi:hypothetical protein